MNKTYKPEDYNITVTYVLPIAMDFPRTVTVYNFDYLYVEIAAMRVAEAIRKDICQYFNLTWAFADYLDIAI